MSEWHDVQKELNTKLRDLLKTKKVKTRKLSEISKTEQKRRSFMSFNSGK